MSTTSPELKPAVLMRRMTNPVIVGPQMLALDSSAPMLRFPAEASRSRLTVVLPTPLATNSVVQWLQNGSPIQGESRTTLVIENPTVSDSDVYWAEVSDGTSTIRSQSFLLMVHAGLPLQNQSVRGKVQPGQGLTAGFTIGRATGPLRPRQLLIRGISPSLAKFGVKDVLSRVKVSLFRRAANCSNLFNFDADLMANLTAKIGAFALSDDATEFSALVELGPGTYSVVLESDQVESGEALIEIYDTLA